MNGKKTKIRKKDFLVFAEECGIAETTAEKLIQNLITLTPKWLLMCENSLLPTELRNRLSELIIERTDILK